ncbi:CBS domain-containing protein [Candidatus Poribacteria bacterium]|nr:CBS domain-containing protein [Candidatus Poribacteria bacterium]
MELKRAGNIMIPLDRYPHIPYWFTLRQAIAEMEKSELETNGRKSLPRILLVFDEAYKLLGMVRRRDILRGLEPKFLTSEPLEYRKKLFNVKVDPTLFELSSEKMVKGIREQAERPVSEVMLPIVATVDYADNIIKVIYEMVDNNVSLLPVLQDQKVVGVVRSVDVFHEAARILLE